MGRGVISDVTHGTGDARGPHSGSAGSHGSRLAQNYTRCPATPPSTTVDPGVSQICELSPKSSVQWMCDTAAVANMRVLRIANSVGAPMVAQAKRAWWCCLHQRDVA